MLRHDTVGCPDPLETDVWLLVLTLILILLYLSGSNVAFGHPVESSSAFVAVVTGDNAIAVPAVAKKHAASKDDRPTVDTNKPNMVDWTIRIAKKPIGKDTSKKA
jgi:hypothetical protein